MVQALVFDWGGVLIEDPAPGLMRYCADYLRVRVGDLEAAFACFGADLQIGAIDEGALWEGICRTLSCQAPRVASLWGTAFRAIYRPRPAMFALAARLQHQGIHTAILSNTEKVVREYFQEQHYTMFDAEVFSCDEGVAKPAPILYERTLERLGVAAAATVFLDDRPEFVQGACHVGMRGIQFQGVQACLAALHSLGLPVE